MDKEAWQATVHSFAKSRDTTEPLTLSLSYEFGDLGRGVGRELGCF